jgi:hypothetical protein
MNTPEGRELCAIRMIAKMPTIAAMTYKYSMGQAFVYPDEDLSFTENFLYMMFGAPNKKFKQNSVISKALDKIFILHADHEQNASTSTVRTAGSSGPNPFACVSAGIASLWGPAHGGANEAVISMLSEIGSVKNIPQFIEKAKDKVYISSHSTPRRDKFALALRVNRFYAAVNLGINITKRHPLHGHMGRPAHPPTSNRRSRHGKQRHGLPLLRMSTMRDSRRRTLPRSGQSEFSHRSLRGRRGGTTVRLRDVRGGEGGGGRVLDRASV